MKLKVGKNQVLRPSGIVVSKDGKYFYWSCSISGVATFANADRFKTVLARYGNDETKLVKEFVCRPAQRYLDAGYKPEDIRKLAEENKGKLVNINAKPKKPDILKKPRKKGLKAFAIGSIQVAEKTATGSIEIVEKKVYPWSGDADYFGRNTSRPAAVADVTVEACMFPARYLDSECRDCPVYADCVLPTKCTEKDWKKSRKEKKELVVKPLDSFDASELPSPEVES
jgi:hypothetical protein